MDQALLVEIPIDEGRRFVERFAADGNRIQAAFWVKTSEDGLWFLYVVSELYDRMGPAAAYEAVGETRRKLCEISETQLDVKLIGPNNPIAKDILELMKRQPRRTMLGSTTLGSLQVDQAFIYPARYFTFTQAKPMTSDEICQHVFGLMNNRSAIVQPSHVNLKDGTGFDGIPFAIEVGPHRSLTVRFIAEGEAGPQVVPLDEIASIN